MSEAKSRPFTLSRRNAIVGAASAVAAALHGPAAAQPLELQTLVDGVVRPLMSEHDIPGMAVGITVGGRRSVFSYGVKASDSEIPVTPETIFEVGSVSKVFTAHLACLGHARGRLDWSDPLARHLNAFTGSAIGSRSLLHLGTYTAGGLPLHFPEGVNDDPSALAFLRDWTPTDQPGAVRRYSNPSLGVFGRAAAAALGRDFTDAMDELIAGLGLRRTFIKVPDRTLDDYAWGHDGEGRRVRVRPGAFDAEAYGIKSSAADLLRLMEVNMDPSSLPHDLRQAVLKTHPPHFEVGDMMQALGWERYKLPMRLEAMLAGNSKDVIHQPQSTRPVHRAVTISDTLFNKTGSTNGFGAYLAFVPLRRVGVVLLANRNFPIPARVSAAYSLLRSVAGNG